MSIKIADQQLNRPPPFVVQPSLTAFQVPYKTYLSTVPKDIFTSTLTPTYIAVGALVFDPKSRILLLQRASTDSMPSLWETPGGACDEEDETILHSVARELEEEAGLIATSVGPLVDDGYVFLTISGNVVCKYSFLVGIADGLDQDLALGGGQRWVKVRLDPNEHQNHVWATEEEVELGRTGDVVLKFTTAEQKQIILDAFQVRRRMEDGSAAQTKGRTATG